MALTSEAAGAARESAQRAVEGARSVVADLIEAVRSAAYGVLDEQKARAAREVADVALAVRSGAQALEKSDNRAAAHYVERAALGIEHVAEAMRKRSWSDILAEAEEFAQRRPALFVFGAIAAGFAAGCLVSPPPRGEMRRKGRAAVEPSSRLAAAAEEPEPAHRSSGGRRAKDN